MHRKVSQYNAFKLNEYRDTYEIVGGNEGEDGKFYMTWVIVSEYDSDVGGGIPVTKDDGSYRNLPIKIVLGNRVEAIENLQWLLGQLENQKDGPGKAPHNSATPDSATPDNKSSSTIPPSEYSDDIPF